MKNLLALAAAGLLLAGCAATPSGSSAPAASNPMAKISTFTVADLQNADKIAVAQNDLIGHACYPALVTFISALPTSLPSTTVSGAASAFETARAARLQAQSAVASGIPAYLKLSCSALLLDEQTFLANLAALAGLGAAAAPLLPAVLPAIGAGLPTVTLP